MTAQLSGQTTAQKPRLERSGVNRLIQVIVTVLVIGIMLFVSAGRLDWTAAWLFLGVYTGIILTLGVWAIRKNPDVVNERGRLAKNIKGWDKILVTLYSGLSCVAFIVAGLDAGRFGWSMVPTSLQIAGLVCLVLESAMTYWAMAVNPFLAAFVRIQTDRGQYVVTTGPYRYVRHPMYAGILIMWPSIALALGSWWALVPAAAIALVFVIRTALEDRTLQAELPGYAEYARQTRYRLIPGVW